MRGTPIPDMKTSQARNRRIKELKTRAQKALHFCTLLGLELDLLRLNDPEGLKTYTVSLSDESLSPQTESKFANSNFCVSSTSDNCSCQFTTSATLLQGNSPALTSTNSSCSFATNIPLPTSPDGGLQSQSTDQASNKKETQYSRISEDDKARVESILFLIDKFGVGDEFMHELTMTVEGLPKSYLFKQCSNALNESCYIKSTPGKAPGAQHSFSKLLKDLRPP